MRRVTFDLESPGLLDAYRIWCVAIKDLDSGDCVPFRPGEIDSALDILANASVLVGHNICAFDIKLIQKLYPRWSYTGVLRDTMCMSKLFEPERQSHSLESYGLQYGRLKPDHEDWSRFSEEMMHRCMEDTEITSMVYEKFIEREISVWDWEDALELEQEFAAQQVDQEEVGVTIDRNAVEHLMDVIDARVDEISDILLTQMPKRTVNKGPVNKPFKKDGSYSKMTVDWCSL